MGGVVLLNTDGGIMRRPSGIIFDYGDTVLHLESIDVIEGNRRILELADFNPGVTAEDAAALAEEMFRWLDTERNNYMLEVSAASIDRLIFDTLGVTFRVDYDELEKAFWNGALTYKPVDGIFELLDMLDANGIKTGIISNSINKGTILEEELEKHNLAHRFSFVMSSADYVVRKPHRYLFQVALKKMGLSPSEVWFVGDKIEYDIRGALDSGLYPVWYNWMNQPAAIDGDYLEVKDLHELREKIESLCTN